MSRRPQASLARPDAAEAPLDAAAFDRLFETPPRSSFAGLDARATSEPHCPATVPIRTCEETRFGPCV